MRVCPHWAFERIISMKKRFLAITSLVLICAVLCACQPTPNVEAVNSKNNGVLQEKINETNPHSSLSDSCESIYLFEDFLSTDESVSFHFNVNTEISSDMRTVVEVVPHRLSAEDIQRVARTLLGNVTFYERRTSSSPMYSKSQYQEMISQLSPYTSLDTLSELMGNGDAEVYLEYVRMFVEKWIDESENAPESDPRTICDWKLKKERHYNDSNEEIGNRQVSDDCDVLYANAEKDGIEYIYSVTTKDGGDYKLNSLNLNLTEGLGLYPVEMAIFRSMLCRTEKPSDAQVEKVSSKAQAMLNEMNLGEWSVTNVYIETKRINNIDEYSIHVNAVPSFDGITAVYGQRSKNLKDAYASIYKMSQATFEFSANGDILYFNMESPIDIVEVKNRNVATIDVDELIEKCKKHLSLSDAGTYGLPEDIIDELEAATNEEILCYVYLSEVECGLGRVKVQDTEDAYYYIPVIVFRGYTDYISAKTQTLYYSNKPDSSSGTMPVIVCINAVDGTVVQ